MIAFVMLGLLLVLAGGVAAVVMLTSGAPDATLGAEVASARRHALASSALSAAAAFLAVTVLIVLMVRGEVRAVVPDAEPIVIACLPLIGILVALLVLLLGELTWPRPTGATRSALLHDRAVPAYLRGRWPRTGLLSVVLLTLVLLTGGLLGDDTGRGLTHDVVNGSRGASPFPGWGYGVPQLILLGLCVAAVTGIARATTRRPAVVTADLDTDTVLRRASVARAFRALTAGALLTLGPDLVTGGSALDRTFVGESVGLLGLVLLYLGMVVVVVGVVALVLPVPRLPRRRQAGGPRSASVPV